MMKKAISLITLVITVIVLAILATVSILALGGGNLFSAGRDAAFKERLLGYQDEVEAYYSKMYVIDRTFDKTSVNASEGGTLDISTVIPSIQDNEKDEFLVINGQLKISVLADKYKIDLAAGMGVLTDKYDAAISMDDIIAQSNFKYTISNGEACLTGFLTRTTTNNPAPSSKLVIPYEIKKEGVTYPVTSIGEEAFSYCRNITTVVIPTTVKEIRANAFYYCPSLTTVVFSEGLEKIGDYAFYSSSITEITLSDTVKEIEDYAFASCRSMKKLSLGKVQILGEGAFTSCVALTTLEIPNTLTYIGNAAFNHCYALESAVIPGSVTTWVGELFYKCSGLKSVKILGGVTNIPRAAFHTSSIETVSIPSTVTSISIGAFRNCSSLKTVYFGGTEEQWASISIESYNDALKNANIIYN